MVINRQSHRQTTFVKNGHSELIKIQDSIYEETTTLKNSDVKSKELHADEGNKISTIIEEQTSEIIEQTTETKTGTIAPNTPNARGYCKVLDKKKNLGTSHISKVGIIC